MSTEQIIEGNKLIAEFMGYKIGMLSGWLSGTAKEESAYKKDTNDNINDVLGKVSNLKYHTSWDWLMLVVDKINTIDNREYDVIIWRSDCHINNRMELLFESSILRGNKTIIETVWGCIIEFIKWYNTKTTNQ